MTLRVCLTCLTAFAVGLPLCPHCGSQRHAEEGTAEAIGVRARGRFKEEEDMPKITRHGGPSDKADITKTTGEDTAPEPTPAAPAEAAEATAEEPAVKATPRRRSRSKS